MSIQAKSRLRFFSKDQDNIYLGFIANWIFYFTVNRKKRILSFKGQKRHKEQGAEKKISLSPGYSVAFLFFNGFIYSALWILIFNLRAVTLLLKIGVGLFYG